MLSLGLRLRWLADGTDRVTYGDVYVILTEASEESPISRAIHGEWYGWGIREELLAGIFDQLQYARYEQHGKGKEPEPFPRPGKAHRGSGSQMGSVVSEPGLFTPEGETGAIASGANTRADKDGNMTIRGELLPADELLKVLGLEEHFSMIVERDG